VAVVSGAPSEVIDVSGAEAAASVGVAVGGPGVGLSVDVAASSDDGVDSGAAAGFATVSVAGFADSSFTAPAGGSACMASLDQMTSFAGDAAGESEPAAEFADVVVALAGSL